MLHSNSQCLLHNGNNDVLQLPQCEVNLYASSKGRGPLSLDWFLYS